MKVATALLLAVALAVPAAADDFQQIPEDRAEGIARSLGEMAGKLENLPAKVEFDFGKSRGLFDPGNDCGLMIVPGKNLKEDREDPALSKDKGRPIAGVFFYNLLPTGVSERDKLFKVQLKDDDGTEREVRFAVATVRKKSDDEFFLQLWGKAKEPLAEAAIGEADGDADRAIDVASTGSEMTVKLLGRYGARLGIKVSRP